MAARATAREPAEKPAPKARSAGHSSGAIAQLGERLLCKQEVVGSIPSGSTSRDRTSRDRARHRTSRHRNDIALVAELAEIKRSSVENNSAPHVRAASCACGRVMTD